MQHKNPCKPFSEESSNMIHENGKVKYFEMCETSTNVQCIYCLKYRTHVIVYCRCGMCVLSSERSRQSRFDALSIPKLHDQKRVRPMVLGTAVPKDCEHIFQAHNHSKKAKKKGFTTNLQRFQECSVYRSSQPTHGWDEKFCKRLDELALEVHSYVSTRQKRE